MNLRRERTFRAVRQSANSATMPPEVVTIAREELLKMAQVLTRFSHLQPLNLLVGPLTHAGLRNDATPSNPYIKDTFAGTPVCELSLLGNPIAVRPDCPEGTIYVAPSIDKETKAVVWKKLLELGA